ncbi:MAG: VOC family protein, partial [Burkholderiales bacterium]
MPLHHIEHFLIQSADMAATRDWYVNTLGFEEGPHPDFKFPVCWLYLGSRDVIHITEGGKTV